MAGREVDRLGRREGLAIGISMNLGKTVPRVAGGVSVDRIIIEHANNLGHVSSFPHQGRIADNRRLLTDGSISGALSVSQRILFRKRRYGGASGRGNMIKWKKVAVRK